MAGAPYVALSLMCLPDTSWGGGSHRLWKRHSCWMLWSRRYGPVDRPAQSITVIKVLSMYRWPTHSGLGSRITGINRKYWDSYDNAMAESINGLYKAGGNTPSWKTGQKWSWPHSRGWTGLTIDDCWKRLGHIPPAEAEKACYASIGNDDLAA